MQSTTFPRLAIATAITLACAQAQAESNDGLDGQQVASLDPMIVTATRTVQTVEETLSSVSVITRDDIDRQQPESLSDLLQRTQGVEITRNGSRGANASLFLRGTQADHTVVMVDGIRVNTSTSGQASIEAIPLNNIERIEVVRGPRSSLYGADAIGGVIQIFTRESRGPHASLGAGTHNLRTLSTGYGTRSDQGSFSLDLSAESTDGFDTRENDCPGCADEPDDDGFESVSLSTRGERNISETLTLRGQALVAFSENEFDGSFQNESKDRQLSAGAGFTWAALPEWDLALDLAASSDRSRNFLDDDDERNTFQTDRTELRWQNDFQLDQAGLLTAGLDLRRESVGNSEFTTPGTEFDEERRDTRAAFVQHQWFGERTSVEQSIRHEKIDGFGRETTGSLAAGYRLTPRLRAFISAGNAFKAPTFNQLFFPGFGNPDLSPESSRSTELGLRGRMDRVNWDVAVFQTDVDDLILNAVNPNTGNFEPVNIQDAQIRGIEAGVSYSGERWSSHLDLGYKQPEDRESGNQLPRRAKETLNAGVTRSLARWNLGVDITGQGNRFDDQANEVELDAYALVNLRASYQPAPDWTIQANVRNAFDKDYTLAETYNTDGRNYYVQVTYQPGRDD